MLYLLDTNIWIFFLKHPTGRLAKTMAKHPVASIATCSIVRAELLHGAEKYGNRDRRVALVESVLSPFVSLPFDDAAASHYASIRNSLELKGIVIGPYDLQIAAIALAHKLTLVTGNTGEFSRVVGLDTEDWTIM